MGGPYKSFWLGAFNQKRPIERGDYWNNYLKSLPTTEAINQKLYNKSYLRYQNSKSQSQSNPEEPLKIPKYSVQDIQQEADISKKYIQKPEDELIRKDSAFSNELAAKVYYEPMYTCMQMYYENLDALQEKLDQYLAQVQAPDFLQVTITSATTKKSHIPLNEIRDLYAF